jgi:carbon-monoxide dehydrogenase medium subunit
MIPRAFDYVRATTVSDAIRLLSGKGDGATLLAGGHSLIPALKRRVASPSLLIDITSIEALQGIEVADTLRIGALCTHAQILASQPLHDLYPVFRQAANLIGDPQVRNRGTIGGSLANAEPSADWPAVVIAVGADTEIVGPAGSRYVPAKDFFLDAMTTALGPNEVLAGIHMPLPGAGVRSGYSKIHHPASGSAVVGVAVMAGIDGESITQATIGITGAARCAFEAIEAGAYLVGKAPSPEVFAQAASLISMQAGYLEDAYASAEYRAHLLRTETRRLLESLLPAPGGPL